jgi:hypothetical protein
MVKITEILISRRNPSNSARWEVSRELRSHPVLPRDAE